MMLRNKYGKCAGARNASVIHPVCCCCCSPFRQPSNPAKIKYKLRITGNGSTGPSDPPFNQIIACGVVYGTHTLEYQTTTAISYRYRKQVTISGLQQTYTLDLYLTPLSLGAGVAFFKYPDGAKEVPETQMLARVTIDAGGFIGSDGVNDTFGPDIDFYVDEKCQGWHANNVEAPGANFRRCGFETSTYTDVTRVVVRPKVTTA